MNCFIFINNSIFESMIFIFEIFKFTFKRFNLVLLDNILIFKLVKFGSVLVSSQTHLRYRRGVDTGADRVRGYRQHDRRLGVRFAGRNPSGRTLDDHATISGGKGAP